jgi:hypothetical protein
VTRSIFVTGTTNHNPEQLEEEFPYWKCLHGFWRTLPNFNPFTASSEPGQNLGADALAFIQTWGCGVDEDNTNLNSYDDARASASPVQVGVNDDGGLLANVCFCFCFPHVHLIYLI